MPHFRVDDALHSHPKARQAGLEAMGLWNLCGSYCMGYLTDGFVPEWYVKTWPKGMALAKRLVTARMWYPAEKDGETGWQFHEFTGPGRNDSREQVEESRKKWRNKKAGQRADSPPDSPRDSRGASPGDATRDSRRDSLRATRDPTQPNPTEEFSGQLSESATDSNGRGAVAATPGADLVRRIVPSSFPGADRTMLRIKASALINEGIPTADVEAALRLWVDKPGIGPGLLPSLVSDVIKNRNGPVNGQPTAFDRKKALNGAVFESLADQPHNPEILA